MRSKLRKYRKALVAVAGVAAVFGKVAIDGSISAQEAAELLGAVAIAFGVYRVPNEPDAKA